MSGQEWLMQAEEGLADTAKDMGVGGRLDVKPRHVLRMQSPGEDIGENRILSWKTRIQDLASEQESRKETWGLAAR